MAEYNIYNENNLETLKRMPGNSLDAVVTDAPYGLGKEPDPLKLIQAWATTGYMEIKGKGFMGKEWDAFVPQPTFWKEVYRVLKPGGYVLCFFGTRTYDWGTLAIRLGGFEIRDCIQWIYGSGFPKSLDVSKAIDKMGEENGQSSALSKDLCNYLKVSRESQGLTQKDLAKYFPSKTGGLTGCVWNWENGLNIPTMEQWTILKEVLSLSDNGFITMIERAIIKRIEAEREVIGHRDCGFIPNGNNIYGKYSGNTRITIAATDAAKTWEGYGTALKPAYEPICVARKPLDGTVAENVLKHECGAINLDGCRIGNGIVGWHGHASKGFSGGLEKDETNGRSVNGRFPANVIFDEVAASILDEQTGQLTSGKPIGLKKAANNVYGTYGTGIEITGYGDTGGASRFFYCAKSSPADRNYGMEVPGPKFSHGSMPHDIEQSPKGGNIHPTVKPISLMRYLVRLVKTPFDNCTIADFFLGSGTTGIACMLEGINFIGAEEDSESFLISKQRIEYAKKQSTLYKGVPRETIHTKDILKKGSDLAPGLFDIFNEGL